MSEKTKTENKPKTTEIAFILDRSGSMGAHAGAAIAGFNEFLRDQQSVEGQARLTLVIYMGVSGAAQIQADLLTGLAPSTPLAIIQNATLPDQRQALTTLDDLCACLQREGLGSPAVIVVGDVLQGAAADCNSAGETHAWFDSRVAHHSFLC